MAKYPRNTLILTTDPFVGFMPADLRDWITMHNTDPDLALALAGVHNHVGILGHELDKTDDHWLIYAFEAWWEVEKELYDLIVASMRLSNQQGKTDYNLSLPGLHWLVKPFMEKNGFRDGTGWWVQAETKTDGTVVMLG